MFTLTRSKYNPLISPLRDHPWEAAAAFNGSPIEEKDGIAMVYRAMSEPDLLRESHSRMSVIASAHSKDGRDFIDRKVYISPDREFDYYGCEDPRTTKLGNKYYTFYTALGGFPFGADNIKVAVGIGKNLDAIDEKHLVTPFNAKAMALFPAKINGKFAALLTVNTDRKPSDICYAEFDKEEDIWDPEYWKKWWENLDSHKLGIRRYDTDHIELGAVPVKVKEGWLLVYSHIQRYGHEDQVFGIETLLLDSKNPREIIGRTKGPFMVPEEYYEMTGMVPRVIFPSGALIRDEKLEVYYGAADTHVAMASIPLETFIPALIGDKKSEVKRYPGNPILSPRASMLWEQDGTLNPAAIDIKGRIHLIYRAVASGNYSTLGYANSTDGLSIDERSDKPIYFPRADFESRGCEDPRLMEIGDKIYMTYTGYDGTTPRVAVSSIKTKDFVAKKFSAWSKPEAISPAMVPNKDAAILPEPVNGGYLVFHRVHQSVCADYVASLDFSTHKISQCIEIITPRKGMWDGGKVGISSPPVKTKEGWLLLYHGVSWSTTYRVGAVLLDLKDPTIVLARTAAPIFEPEEEYERKGIVNNVVFPCGMVVRKNTAFIYYGAADKVVGVATMKMSSILAALKS